MISVYGLVRKLRTFLMRERAAEEISDELEVHLEFQTRKYVDRGMSTIEARRLARLDFGSSGKTQEECWETDSLAAFDAFILDVKYAIRSLSRQPGFALIAFGILAMGIGSSLAVLNLLNAIMFRPLPIRSAGELVRIARALPDGEYGSLPSTFLDGLETAPEFSGVCGFDTGYPGVEIGGGITSVGTLGFSGNCFATLGIQVQIGRSLTPQDNRPGAALVAVITDALWRRRFNRSPDVLGQHIRIEDQTYNVIGVAEPSFSGLLIGFPAGIILPVSQEFRELTPNGMRPTYWWVNILARRAPGISAQQVSARMKVRAGKLLESSLPPHYSAQRTREYLASDIVTSSGSAGIDYFLRRRFGNSLYAAGGICISILLIGCTNLVNLLLARSSGRRHEIAIRFALGASWIQIARLFAMESLLLVTVGAGLGVPLAWGIDRWLLAVGARLFGNFDLRLSFDWPAAVLLAVATLAITLSFAGVSLWQARQVRDSKALKDSGRGIARTAQKLQKIFIGLQISLTIALVTGSGLLTASLNQLYRIDLGVSTRDVWDVELSTSPGAKTYFSRSSYDRQILAEVHQIPGVQKAALTDSVPFFSMSEPKTIAATDTGGSRNEVEGSVLAASSEFFEALGLSLIAGQGFEDREDGEPTAIVSESLAVHLSAQPRDLIDHYIRMGADSGLQRLRVVGVVSNAQLDLSHPEDRSPYMAYVNMWQHPEDQGYPVLIIKTANNSLDLEALRKIVETKGHEYISRVRTLSEEKDGALMENRLLAYLSEVLSGLALGMAAIGLFGLLTYQVANRTSEIGLRMALGAQRTQIQWMIIREIIVTVGSGIGAGLLISLGIARIIGGLLFDVSPYDPRIFALSCAALGATALLAAWIPARRASSVDPLIALRYE